MIKKQLFFLLMAIALLASCKRYELNISKVEILEIPEPVGDWDVDPFFASSRKPDLYLKIINPRKEKNTIETTILWDADSTAAPATLDIVIHDKIILKDLEATWQLMDHDKTDEDQAITTGSFMPLEGESSTVISGQGYVIEIFYSIN